MTLGLVGDDVDTQTPEEPEEKVSRWDDELKAMNSIIRELKQFDGETRKRMGVWLADRCNKGI